MRELQNAFPRSATGIAPAKTRRITILWVGIGGMLVLVGNLGWQHFTGAEKPTALIAILTPANLFQFLICTVNVKEGKITKFSLLTIFFGEQF
jgi:hypothetical protein